MQHSPEPERLAKPSAATAGQGSDLLTFADFWPFYLREHAQPRTRAFHYAGTSLVILLAVTALVSGNMWLLLGMPVAGYGFAWASHAAIERNRPATFTHPLWSLRADFRMWRLWLSGDLADALTAAGVPPSRAMRAQRGR